MVDRCMFALLGGGGHGGRHVVAVLCGVGGALCVRGEARDEHGGAAVQTARTGRW